MLALVIAVWTALTPASGGGPAAPQWLVACYDREDRMLLELEAPRRCDLETADQAFGWIAELRRLEWRSWGESVTTASGRIDGRRGRVRAWRPRRICGDIDHSRAYTRIRITTNDGRVTMRRSACFPEPQVDVPPGGE